MPEGKFKISDTLRFLSRTLNAISPQGSVKVNLELPHDSVQAGAELCATVRLTNDEREAEIDYLVLSMSGQVQREGKWRAYSDSAEIAQGTPMPAHHELVIPVVLHIPEDAVLSEDGASWSIETRVVINRSLDPRDSIGFQVLAPEPEPDA